MRKKLTSIIMILCLSLVFGACGSSPNEGMPWGSPSEDVKDATQQKLDAIRPVTYSSVEGLNLQPGSCISIIGRYSNDSFWKEVENGAKKAVEDMNTMLGYKGSDKIKLTYSAPEVRDDVNEQVNLLDEELDRYPVAVAIATIDATACSIQFDLASENNIPIITFDSGNDYKNIATHVSTDNAEASKTATIKLAQSIDEKGEVAVFVQDSVSTTAKQRLNSFLETMKAQFPEVSVVNVYAMDQLNTMATTIAEEKNASITVEEDKISPGDITQKDVVSYILDKYPNLKGIYATNLDTTQLVAKVLTEKELTNIKFVGFDGGDEQIKLLEDGVLEGLVTQNPFGMGYAAVVAAARTSLGLANKSFVKTKYTWVTKENMKQKEIKNMLY